jgi:predicted enzyme related to lactoylglutathione lyase
MSFSGANIDGGFNGMGDAQISNPGILIPLYASDIDKKLDEVIQAGGKI